jgi:predicted glutamine amidotransferase
MCRLLFVRSGIPFDTAAHLEPFAQVSKNSREYQGHGWGCSWLAGDGWKTYRNVRPVWEDDFPPSGKTTLLLAHARSAFRDEGIAVDNNMPFTDGKTVFIFNGELHGVRRRIEGRIGAEKVYNLVRQYDRGDLPGAIRLAVTVLEKQSQYIRAMNFFISNGRRTWASSLFSEDPEYFTLHRRDEKGLSVVCSEPYPGETGWDKIPNRFIGEV